MEENKKSGLCIAALVCGLVSILLNPMYLVSLAAIILGAIGLGKSMNPKGFALTGVIAGAATLLFGCLFDTLISLLTMGLGLPAFFI